MVVDLERGVGVAPSEPDDVVAPIVELDEPVANHVVRQTDVVHDKHAAIHLPTRHEHSSHRHSTQPYRLPAYVVKKN